MATRGRPAKYDYSLKREGESNRNFRRRMFNEQRAAVVPAIIEVPADRTSKRFDADGTLRGYSVFQKQSDLDRIQKWSEVAAGFRSEIEPAPSFIHYMTRRDNDLRACFPIGDHHLGMLAWRPEVGSSYDLDIGERMLNKAMAQLIKRTNYAGSALIVVLGDFLHYDGKLPVTQRGGNILDAEGRYRKMIRVAIRSLRATIEFAAQTFATVDVIVEPGNHDEFAAAFLSEALADYYANTPLVRIDTTPGRFHYHRYGGNLIGVTHGDLAKPSQLPGIMAVDRPGDWADTVHRTWWTGHVHHHFDQAFAGCNVEAFGILPPTDAWAHGMGYRSKQEMKAIVLHERGGEFARYTVTPSQIGDA